MVKKFQLLPSVWPLILQHISLKAVFLHQSLLDMPDILGCLYSEGLYSGVCSYIIHSLIYVKFNS